MAWAYVIRTHEREIFKRCRRLWDFASGERNNLEPVNPRRTLDFQRAVQDALAVYYFPGMWEWNRRIVLPLVIEGFYKSIRKQMDGIVEERGAESPEEQSELVRQIALCEPMLNRYFEWATSVDDFSPIQVEPDFEVNIPDPGNPGRDLIAPASSPVVPIRYRGRVNLLAVDANNAYWIMEHRVVEGAWEETETLLLDERGVSHCWGLENFFPGMKIAGIIYNELRKDTSPSDIEPQNAAPNLMAKTKSVPEASPAAGHRRIYLQAVREPDFTIKHTFCGNFFRRTQIPRSRATIENFGRQIVAEAMEITNPDLRIYPNPTKENCSRCAFVKPCIAMNEGSDTASTLSESYRKRSDSEFEPGRLGGSTFSIDRGAMPPGRSGR